MSAAALKGASAKKVASAKKGGKKGAEVPPVVEALLEEHPFSSVILIEADKVGEKPLLIITPDFCTKGCGWSALDDGDVDLPNAEAAVEAHIASGCKKVASKDFKGLAAEAKAAEAAAPKAPKAKAATKEAAAPKAAKKAAKAPKAKAPKAKAPKAKAPKAKAPKAKAPKAKAPKAKAATAKKVAKKTTAAKKVRPQHDGSMARCRLADYKRLTHPSPTT